MKNYIFLLLICITINYAHAQTKHEWKVTLKVVDETGLPVMGAKAGVNYYTNRTLASMNGPTDADGIFTASHLSYGGEIGFAVEKAGYYAMRELYVLGFTYHLNSKSNDTNMEFDSKRNLLKNLKSLERVSAP